MFSTLILSTSKVTPSSGQVCEQISTNIERSSSDFDGKFIPSKSTSKVGRAISGSKANSNDPPFK